MKHLQLYNPFLAIIALGALFFKLPETPNLFGFFKCKMCPEGDPYIPIIASGYFAALLAVSLLFFAIPPLLARIGMAWSILLAIGLTYVDLPNVCSACLIAHLCNILMWSIWSLASSTPSIIPSSPLNERVFFTLLAPITVMALFTCLNLTFMLYNLKYKHSVLTKGFTLFEGEYPLSNISDKSQ